MKTSIGAILIVFFLLLQNGVYSAVITPVINNGDWDNVSTWDLGRIPEDLDIVNIPEGITVKISSNLYNAVPRQPDLIINVHGVLQMIGTGQINIGCGSKICVINNGIIPATSCNCNQINVGAGGAEWKGQHDEDLTGGQCITGSCFLPVTLTSFTVTNSASGNQLNWTSSEEINFDQFELERSLDGISFEKISSIKGTGSTELGESYSYLDHTANAEIIYYRLKMVDKDLTSAYSQILAVKNKVDFTCYPNPVSSNGSISIVLPEEMKEVDICLKDLAGKLIGTYSFSDLTIIELYIPTELSTGMYVLTVSGNGYLSSKVFVLN